MFHGSNPTERSAFKKFLWPTICILLTILKVWLVRAQMLHVVAPYVFDDEHFLVQGEALLRGEWVGNQSFLTLSKGLVYPLWLALNHLTGLPLLTSQALLYAAACWTFARALRPQFPAGWTRAIIYLVVLFNPASWDYQAATRLMRENIYPTLTLFLFAAAIGAALRAGKGVKASLPWALLAGLSGALLAMTREEGVWVVPSLLVIVGWGIWSVWRQGLKPWAIPLLCALFAYGLPIVAMAEMNLSKYGVFTTCETTTGYFKSVYGALTRIKVRHWNPYVPVPREARQRLFAVSPSFQPVEPLFEQIILQWNPGCEDPSLRICDDIAGGWFQWAFRYAVAAAGNYQAGLPQARAYYGRLTREIDNACRSGELDCYPPRSGFMSPWHNEYLAPLVASVGRGSLFLTTFEQVAPAPPAPSTAPASYVHRFAELARERLPLVPSVAAVRPDVITTDVPLGDLRLKLLVAVRMLYAVAMPLLLAAALALVVAGLLRSLRTRTPDAVALLAVALFGAVAARILLLALIDVSSFPAISTLYLSAAYPLYVGAVALVLVHALERRRSKVEDR